MGAQRPFGAAKHSERRCSEANRRRCARIDHGAKEPRALASGPNVRAKPFGLPFRRLEKVTRRKGGTLSGRYCRNGYVLSQKKPPPDKKPSRASSLPQLEPGTSARDWSAIRPPSLASQLPQGFGYIRNSYGVWEIAIASRLTPTGLNRFRPKELGRPEGRHVHSASGSTLFWLKYRFNTSSCPGTEASPATCHNRRSIPCATICPTAASIADNTHNCAGSFVV